jgi:hypothetical protein
METIDAHIDHIADICAITTPHDDCYLAHTEVFNIADICAITTPYDDSDRAHMLYTEVFSRKNKKKKCVTFKGDICG